MQPYGWRDHVRMTSLLQVIEASDRKVQERLFNITRHQGSLYKPVGHAQSNKRKQVLGVRVDDINSLNDRLDSERNRKLDNPQLRRFLDSDNILLSVFDHESRRRREVTRQKDNPVAFSDTNLRFPRISPPLDHFHRKSKLSVSVPSTCDFSSEGNKFPGAELVRLQYCHRSNEESSRNIANKIKVLSIVNDIPGDDSIDVVVAANKPTDLTTAAHQYTPPVIRIHPPLTAPMPDHCVQLPEMEPEERQEEDTVSEDPPQKENDSVTPEKQYNVDLDDDIDCLEDDPDVALIPALKNQLGDRRKRHKHQSPTHQYSIDQNLHRNVYMRALRDARNKYFKHVPLDKTVTKPFEFSYFSLLNRNETGDGSTEKRMKKPYGMKRIFGEIRLDEYYPVIPIKK